MNIELHINGRLNIELTPETDIERAVLQKMRELASNGRPVKMEAGDAAVPGSVIVSVET